MQAAVAHRPVSADMVSKYSAPVPRYTSYPTAPHFHDGVRGEDYARCLRSLEPGSTLSLYLHLPFCDSLCWFCACTTRLVRRYEPVARYLRNLHKEAGLVRELLPAGHSVRHLHWGGGSPDILSPEDILHLAHHLRESFNFDPCGEFAVEVDPRGLTPGKVGAFARAGVTRVSIGVQDFDPQVQSAINRSQSFEQTSAAVDLFRLQGVRSINIDLVYGLPHQSLASVARTAELVLRLAPDRIALFGYAHLPHHIRRQRMIEDEAVPGALARFEQAACMTGLLMQAGYARVGLDHFARPSDPLAQGPIRRNFQGYTTDACDALIGLGASAIGLVQKTYVQNVVATAEYERRIERGQLATERGYALGLADQIRAWAIERLMCDLRLSTHELRERFGTAAEPLIGEAQALVAADADGLVEPLPDGFRVTERGRPFLRSICARFDGFLQAGHGHSIGV